MTMVINGSGTITGLTAGGLPDATIQQADLATGVAGTGPAFSAYGTTAQQNVTSGVATKVQLNAELFDTNNNYDKDTNYRFQPTVAGYYQINFSVYPYTIVTYIVGYLYKNGASITFNQSFGASASAVSSYLVYMNGSSDYLELYAQLVGTTPAIYNRADLTYFNGALVRAA